MRGNKAEAVGAGLFVDEIIDVALAVDRDLPGLVARDRHVAHQLEQRVQRFGPGVRVFDELKSVGAHRIVGANGRRRRVVRKWTHRWSPWLQHRYSLTNPAMCMQMEEISATVCTVCAHLRYFTHDFG